ncbi:MAG TPA: serine/threonine-protein kinase [Polyangiaceae bacterium]|nr:serine/threonine-protein kinase [Polyangiaceae bacterium]
MNEPVAVKRGLPSSICEGEILGGKYRLEREIGRGSMGTVWSAVHLTLGQRVAIKLIAAEHAQAEEARQRFSTEAKAAARLRSRYVVQVYDDGETSAGTPYIVLEYLDGETLEQRLEREHDLPLNDAVRMTRHVARALSRAHAAGIVHRDLKPANVFLTRSDDDEQGWVAKVLDFGIAKVEEHGIASTTKTGALLGTPLFMSPEQVRGANSVDSRSDLYSLGMVFYNALTGGYAFNGDSFADVLVAICTAPLPDLRAAAPWVPASIADWFQRACARDAQDRFQSADELIEGLDLALGVTTGAYARQSSPEVRLDTLRGHAPPIQHSIPRGAPSDSGEFTKGSTHVMSTDQALLATNHGAHTVAPEVLSLAPSPRKRWIVGGVFAVLALLAGIALLGRNNGVQPTSEATPPPSALPTALTSVATTPAIPTAPPPTTVAAEQSLPVTSAGTAPNKPAPIRASAPKSATPPARTNKAVSKALAPTPVSPRSTNTDMGF